MVAQVKKSGLMAKYGASLDAAVQAHAADETDYGFIRLPGGISNGVAQLIECTFGQVAEGKQNAGEYYFRAAATVIEPESITTPEGQVVQVAGLQTSIMEMVCETRTRDGVVTTQDEHVANILNHLRALSSPGYTEGATGNDLEGLAAGLKEMSLKRIPIYLKFSTQWSKPQIDKATGKLKVDPNTGKPYELRVWENWHGNKGLENYTPPDGNKDTRDATAPAPAQPAAANGAGKSPPAKRETLKAPNKDALQKQVQDAQPPMDEFGDLASLARRADEEDDSDAIDQLEAYALKCGLQKRDIENSPNWTALLALIESAGGGQEEEEWAGPEVGKTYQFHWMDPVTKKPSPMSVDVEILAVDVSNQKANIKNLETGKSLKGVPWAKIVR